MQSALPVKLGKPYPLGQCLEISQAVLGQLQPGALGAVPVNTLQAQGRAAVQAFLQAGGLMRLVWGDLRGAFFQNAFQLGTFYLDVANDTVDPTKPKVEILPFEQARLVAVADFQHFAALARGYWQHRVFANHVLPEVAPYCPLVHLAPDGTVSIKECSQYMVGMTRAGQLAPSQAVLQAEPMPQALFNYMLQALAGGGFALPASASEGRHLALQACKAYREQGWYKQPSHAAKLSTQVHKANHRLLQAAEVAPLVLD